jgi:hypothetical protein
MNIQYKNPYTYGPIVIPVWDYVERSLNSSDYDMGAVETVEQRSVNIAQALGMLMEKLADKGVLNCEEVVTIAGEYFENQEFVE